MPEDFLKEIEAERVETQKQFDLLVIRRFTEMIMESSGPKMFVTFDVDIEKLIKTRKLNK